MVGFIDIDFVLGLKDKIIGIICYRVRGVRYREIFFYDYGEF